MEWWQAAVLALIQGLTEFLPISSSGHLVLVPRLLGWPDQGLAFDVAVHVGTLLGVLLYFRRDLGPLACGAVRYVGGDRENIQGRLAIQLILATLPVGLVGLIASDFIESELRSPFVVAFQLAAFGILLWLADRFSARKRSETSLSTGEAILIGCAQVLALIPGTSRSGVTMSAALVLGLTRESAARFAFLLAIPGIAAAGFFEAWKFFSSGGPIEVREMLIGMAVAAVVGYACILYFLRFIARIGFLPFTIYRLLLAAIVFAVFY